MTLTNGTNYTVKLWPADGTTPESAAGTATGTFSSRSGFAGIAGPTGSPLSMNVYYVLIENSQLPSISVGGGTAGTLPSGTALSVAAGAALDMDGAQRNGRLALGRGPGGQQPTGHVSRPDRRRRRHVNSVFGNASGRRRNARPDDGGPGSLTLTGTNTFSGGTTVSGGN